jgi:uncharacterized protein
MATTQQERPPVWPAGSNGSNGSNGAVATATLPAPVATPATQEIADPAPFGLIALSVPLIALSWINIGKGSLLSLPVVFTTMLFYGGIGQFVVAMWEVRRNNMFGVAAFGTFGLFNVSVWYFFTKGLPTIPAAGRPGALALFMAVWAIPAFILWVASLRTNMVITLIFGLATILFIVAAIGQGNVDETLIKLSGWVGVALAAVAWYGALSALTAETFGRVLLPNPSLKK